MVSPVNVTEMAASKIAQLLDEEKKTEAGLRVFVQGGGCSGFRESTPDRGASCAGLFMCVSLFHLKKCNFSEI